MTVCPRIPVRPVIGRAPSVCSRPECHGLSRSLKTVTYIIERKVPAPVRAPAPERAVPFPPPLPRARPDVPSLSANGKKRQA